MNTLKKLDNDTIANLKDLLSIELAKRGFHAPFTITQEAPNTRHYDLRLLIESSPFITVPTLFKSIRFDNFGGAVTQDEENADILRVWIPMHVSYEHFDGGTNGCEIFRFTCGVRKDNNRIFEERIS